MERGIALAAEQYRKAVEKFGSKPMESADVQTDLEQNTESQTAGDIPAHTSLETLEQSELDWDPYELFSASEDSAASNTDTAADSPMLSEGIENTEAFEQSFLSGLQSDEESGIMQVESHEETVEPAQTAKAAEQAQKPLTAQERLALLGAALLDKGGMPSPKQLSAMGMDAPTARGIQSLVWLATEGDPAARRKVEAMIDLTDGDGLLPERIENSDQIPLAVDMQYEHEFDSVYTGKIKWGIHDINVRQDGRGFWGQRIQQSDPRVDRYELQINPRNESYYLPHPEGGYVQFENMVNMTVQDGKLILNKKSFYHVDDLPSFAKSKVLAEARRQLAAAQAANYKVEWLISDKNAAKQLRRFFDQQNVEIKITYYPEDGGL